jgi:hypothetical protein
MRVSMAGIVIPGEIALVQISGTAPKSPSCETGVDHSTKP